MPEDNKEPTEREEQARYDKHVPKDKQTTRKVYCSSPQELVNFLMSFGSYNVYLTASRIKKKFPQLRVSVKRINEFMKMPEFHEAVREQIPEATKRMNDGRYETILEQYYEGQMQLKRDGILCPDNKAVITFGQLSGKYDPAQKMEVYDGDKVTKEKEKQLNDEIVNALLNRIKREQDKKEGELNGDERS